MVDNSIYYKERGEIYWIVNKNFDSKDLYIPNFVKVKKCMNSAKRNLNIKLPYEFFLITKNILSNFSKLQRRENFTGSNAIKYRIHLDENLSYKDKTSAWTGDTQGFEFLYLNKRFAKLFGLISLNIRKYTEQI